MQPRCAFDGTSAGTPMPRALGEKVMDERSRIDQTGLSGTLIPPKRWKTAPNAGRMPAAGEPEWPQWPMGRIRQDRTVGFVSGPEPDSSPRRRNMLEMRRLLRGCPIPGDAWRAVRER